MRWPPNKFWTSATRRNGFRHFEVKQYGGRKEGRWVILRPLSDKHLLIKISWSEMKTDQWKTGWLQLPNVEDSSDEN